MRLGISKALFQLDLAVAEPHHKSVFVVDDEPVIASSLSLILRQNGFDAIPFTEPLLALQAAFLRPPKLIISKVIMPLLLGIELAIQMRAQCPESVQAWAEQDFIRIFRLLIQR
jgi:PleD family two-component response regulator